MSANHVALVLQARLGSTRLAQKALRPILGKPMLAYQLERLRHAQVDALIVATGADRANDPIEALAFQEGFTCFRGSEDDVLDRYYQATRPLGAHTIVRVTGDCPLHDPRVVDLTVARAVADGLDYATAPRTFPEGFDTEVFTFAALEAAWKDAVLPSEREHVTPYIRNHPERFRTTSRSTGKDSSHIRLSVDTADDFDVVSRVIEMLYPTNPLFSMEEVVDLLEAHPDWLKLTAGKTGLEGYERSLKDDQEFLRRQR
jgi:spore coat polysaccharide biosynthesis protein SpsF (cytidylyltransferase family)